MRDVGDISNSQASLPITSIDECTPISWIVWVLSWPELYGHIVNVNPATVCCFPSHFIFSNFDYNLPLAKAWNEDIWSTGWTARSRPGKIHVRNCYTTTSFTDGIIAFLIIRISNKYVPFPINHVSVDIVWTAWMVNIIPRVDIYWICFVCYVD